MNLHISIKPYGVALQALFEVPKLAEQGQRRAANRTASRLRTRSIKGIGEVTFLKAAYVRERIAIRQARPGQPGAALVARRRETRTDRFPYRQVFARGARGQRVKAGISVRIKRGRPPETIASAFLVPLKRRNAEPGTNGTGIAIRTDVLRQLGQNIDKSSLGGRGSRQYEVLHSSSVRDLFVDQVRNGQGDDALRFYALQVETELRRALRRGRS